MQGEQNKIEMGKALLDYDAKTMAIEAKPKAAK
jgi:hypothetical protein